MGEGRGGAPQNTICVNFLAPKWPDNAEFNGVQQNPTKFSGTAPNQALRQPGIPALASLWRVGFVIGIGLNPKTCMLQYYYVRTNLLRKSTDRWPAARNPLYHVSECLPVLSFCILVFSDALIPACLVLDV